MSELSMSKQLGTEIGTAFVDGGAAGDDIVVRLRPERWRTSDFAKLDLPGA